MNTQTTRRKKPRKGTQAPHCLLFYNNVEADRGMVAIERGPIVYCAEWPDNDFDIMGTLVNQKPKMPLRVECKIKTS